MGETSVASRPFRSARLHRSAFSLRSSFAPPILSRPFFCPFLPFSLSPSLLSPFLPTSEAPPSLAYYFLHKCLFLPCPFIVTFPRENPALNVLDPYYVSFLADSRGRRGSWCLGVTAPRSRCRCSGRPWAQQCGGRVRRASISPFPASCTAASTPPEPRPVLRLRLEVAHRVLCDRLRRSVRRQARRRARRPCSSGRLA
jgi:hypothetical protein